MIFRFVHRSGRRFVRFLLFSLSLSLLIVACQTPSVKQISTSAEDESADSSCRIVEHAAGQTEVCDRPQKVVALSPHILDIMLALGVQPAGFAQSVAPKFEIYDDPASQVPYLGKWVTTEPIAVGDRAAPSLERLTQLQPDLILGEDWQDDKYSLLSRIAPTLLFNGLVNEGDTRYWQHNIEGIASALWRDEQAKELLAARDQYIDQASAALQPVIQTYPRILLLGSDLATRVVLQAENVTAGLLKEIGFDVVQPEGMDASADISWERVPQIETDIIVVLDWNDDRFMKADAPRREKWAQKPILNAMPIFQQGRVFFADYYLWANHIRGPLSERIILEALPELLLPTVAEELAADGPATVEQTAHPSA